jgi:hypothetical protein
VDSTLLGRLDGPIQARIVEVIDPATSDPMFWPEVATLDLVDAGDEFTASVTIDDVVPWTRVCRSTAVRYPPEPTALAGALVLQPELRATGVQPEHIPPAWGPYSVPAWIESAGPEPALAPGRRPGDRLRLRDRDARVAGRTADVGCSVLSGTSALTPGGVGAGHRGEPGRDAGRP